MFLLGSVGIFRIPKWLEHNLPPFEYFRKVTLTTWLRKAGRIRDSSLFKQTRATCTIQTNDNHHHPFNWYTNTWPRSGPFFWQNLCSGRNSGTDLVVVLEYVFFQLCSKPNEALRFTRFRRSSVNCTAVVLTNNCQSYTTYRLDVCCSKWQSSLFLQLFVPNDSAFAQAIFVEHTCCSHVVNSIVGKQTKNVK